MRVKRVPLNCASFGRMSCWCIFESGVLDSCSGGTYVFMKLSTDNDCLQFGRDCVLRLM